MGGSEAKSSTVSSALSTFVKNYVSNTSVQIKVLDTFLGYVLFVALAQFAYCMLVGTFPFNSFLSGFFAAVGVFVLTVALRFQVVDAKEFDNRTTTQAVAEYIVACAVLFLAVLNFMG